MEMIKRAGFQTLWAEEAAAWMRGEFDLNGPGVVVTFDDGCADNLVHAWPVLRDLEIKATIFLIAGRLEQTAGLRTNHANKPRGVGPFLSKTEVTWLANQGVVSFGSHTLMHAFHFTDSTLLDPCPIPDFSRWTSLDTGNRIIPYHYRQKESSYKGRRFVESLKLTKAMIDAMGTDASLTEIEAAYVRDGGEVGAFESDKARMSRLLQDLSHSKSIIEELTGSPCRTLCWPWGKYDEVSLAAAKEAGFISTFVTERGGNAQGDNPMRILRFEARPKSASWLASRLAIYRAPLQSAVYTSMRDIGKTLKGKKKDPVNPSE